MGNTAAICESFCGSFANIAEVGELTIFVPDMKNLRTPDQCKAVPNI